MRILVVRLALLLATCAMGCAAVTTCTQPLTAQATADAAAVLTCRIDTGRTLAQCEDAQLSVEGDQLTSDVLICAEQQIARVASETHTTGPAKRP